MPQDLEVVAYSDADFAADLHTSRSTTGGVIQIHGPDTRFVMSTVSRKQSAVSHSTPESEIVVLDHTMRVLGIPAAVLWRQLLQREVTLKLHEHNQACIQVVSSGINPTTRQLERAHRVSIDWLH